MQTKWKYWIAVVTLVIYLSGGAACAGEKKQEVSFEGMEVGTLPEALKVEATGQDEALATWEVVADTSAPDGNNVLALTQINHDSRHIFNLCWTDTIHFKNGEIELKFKAHSGKVDQGGGPIWRVKDKDNYYICRANPLESNLRLYYVKDGRRKQIASAHVKISTGEWQEIEVEHTGNHIVCELNDEKLIDIFDDTFTEGGGVGVWTKADAVTSFDAVEIEFGDDENDEQ